MDKSHGCNAKGNTKGVNVDDSIYMNSKQQNYCMTEIRVVDALGGVLAGRRQEGAGKAGKF